MSTITYEGLKRGTTAAENKNTARSVMRGTGLPVDSWPARSEPDALLEFDAEILADLSAKVTEIAKQGVLEDAEGPGLVQHAGDFYDEKPLPAVATEGLVSIVNVTNSSEDLAPGDLLVVALDDGTSQRVYRNSEIVTVKPNATTPVRIVAEEPGDRFNVDASLLTFATPRPGWTMQGAAGKEWVTRAGSDVESSAALRTRCKRKWGAVPLLNFAPGKDGALLPCTDDGYLYLASSASPEVNRIAVVSDPYADPLTTPAVRVFVAGRTGPVSEAALLAASTAIGRWTLGVHVAVENVERQHVTLRGTIKIRTGRAGGVDAATAEIDDSIEDPFAEVAIGGRLTLTATAGGSCARGS